MRDMADDLVVSMPPVTDPSAPPRRRRAVLVVALAAALAALVAVLSVGAYVLLSERAPAGETTAATLEINGIISMRLTYDPYDKLGQPCYPPSGGGYADVTAGASVTVTGPTGSVLALGRLGPGTVELDSEGAGTCAWRFQVLGVPAGQGFYGIEVSHRGRVQLREAELATAVLLTLG